MIKRLIKEIVSITAIVIASLYCLASFAFNSMAIHGNAADASDEAIAQLRSGKQYIIISKNVLDDVLDRIQCDPELFYLPFTFTTSTINYFLPNNMVVLHAHSDCGYNAMHIETMRQEIDSAVDEILSEINVESATDFEKAMYAYLWTKQNVEYSDNSDHSIYSAFINRQAVASGLANAMTYLLSTMDIEAYAIGGMAIDSYGKSKPHAWVLAYLDGNPYYFDPTLEVHLHPDKQRKYFAVTPQEFTKAHVADPAFDNIIAKAYENEQITTPFDCVSEREILTEIDYRYNQLGEDFLEAADISGAQLIAIINEKMGETPSFSQYIQTNSKLSYIDVETGKLCNKTLNSYIYGISNGFISHFTMSKNFCHKNNLYSTTEIYVDKSTRDIYDRWTFSSSDSYDITWWNDGDYLDNNSYLYSWFGYISEEIVVKTAKDGNYVIIMPSTPIIQGDYAVLGQTDYNKYVVGLVDKNFEWMCLYVGNAQVNEQQYAEDHYTETHVSSSVDIFIKLYNFGQIPSIKMPKNAWW